MKRGVYWCEYRETRWRTRKRRERGIYTHSPATLLCITCLRGWTSFCLQNGLKCAKKISRTLLHHHHPEPDGSMLSCCLRQIPTLPSERRRLNKRFPNLPLSNGGQTLSGLSGIGVVFCYCTQSSSRFPCPVRSEISELLGCNEWLY